MAEVIHNLRNAIGGKRLAGCDGGSRIRLDDSADELEQSDDEDAAMIAELGSVSAPTGRRPNRNISGNMGSWGSKRRRRATSSHAAGQDVASSASGAAVAA